MKKYIIKKLFIVRHFAFAHLVNIKIQTLLWRFLIKFINRFSLFVIRYSNVVFCVIVDPIWSHPHILDDFIFFLSAFLARLYAKQRWSCDITFYSLNVSLRSNCRLPHFFPSTGSMHKQSTPLPIDFQVFYTIHQVYSK
jgi:hypothetical protein